MIRNKIECSVSDFLTDSKGRIVDEDLATEARDAFVCLLNGMSPEEVMEKFPHITIRLPDGTIPGRDL